LFITVIDDGFVGFTKGDGGFVGFTIGDDGFVGFTKGDGGFSGLKDDELVEFKTYSKSIMS